MKPQTLLTVLTLLAALLATLWLTTTAEAYWPTTVDKNMIIAKATISNPDTNMVYPGAIPFTDGSTLVVYFHGWIGYKYQIIDRYGELKYSQPPDVYPGLNSNTYECSQPVLISDGLGNVYIIYGAIPGMWPGANDGFFIQKLDSLGNRLFGDSGVEVLPRGGEIFGAALDNTGGLLIAGDTREPALPYSFDVYAQKIDGAGNLLWGEAGILVSALPNRMERWSNVCSDGSGGAFVFWSGVRNPAYGPRLSMQHLDGNGQFLWPICKDVMGGDSPYHEAIPDGVGGFILNANPSGGYGNTLFRYNSRGDSVWRRDNLSYYIETDFQKLLKGESDNYCYLGFFWGYHRWGQKVDLLGNIYWSYQPPNVLGAPFDVNSEILHFAPCEDFAFKFPNLYLIYGLWPNSSIIGGYKYFISGIDQEGNRLWGENGVPIWLSSDFYARRHKIVPLDDAGVVGITEFPFSANHTQYWSIIAKRVNPDGSLGGPLHLLVDLTPQNPPIQIPAGGGSFTFNAAITDTYVVNSHFDAWIELTWPDGRKSDVTLRQNVQIDSNSTIDRTGLRQIVPASAPPGTYTYTLYVGSHEYHIPWSQDGFTFEKVAGGSLLVVGKGTACRAPTEEAGDWTLSGEFFGNQQGVQLNAPTLPTSTDLQVSINPNPFNPTTTIHFTLQEAAGVSLEVFDINGRVVGAHGMRPIGGGGSAGASLAPLQAGSHEIVFDGSNLPSGVYLYRLKAGEQTALGKLILLK